MEANGDPLDPNTWLGESKSLARTFVYAPEVMESITIGIRTGSADLAKLDLSDEYLTNAGRVAQLRAIQAAVRLAGILKQSL